MEPIRVHFVKRATRPSGFPPADRPDVAVAGRSNVGKSSLINTLFGRKALAKVSGTPGKTRLINFFDVDGQFYLVDLPGYGFAKRSRTERESWRRMVEAYLGGRRELVAMLVLMDIRRGPEDEEQMLIDLVLEAHIAPIAVLTKADKLAKNKRRLEYQLIADALGDRVASTILFSSKTGQGRQALLDEIVRWIEP